MPPVRLPLRRAESYAEHKAQWSNCRRCSLCSTRKNVVLYRGDLPCNVLFTGESPGESEDVLGFCFKGPAGHLLDQIVKNGMPPGKTWGFTNLIACIPRAPEGGKLAEPDDESVRACSDRLLEIIRLANPQLIIRVGRHAQMWLEQGYKASIKLPRKIPMADIMHPAAILRLPTMAAKQLEAKRASVTIRDAVERLDTPDKEFPDATSQEVSTEISKYDSSRSRPEEDYQIPY